MAGPQKAPINFNFSQGLDLKTDPKQIAAGKFLNLQNSVFNKGGLFQKRNGFGQLTVLPNTESTYLTTFNGNLTAISNSIFAFSEDNDSWVSKGNIQPVAINTLPLIRSNTSQIQADIAQSANGFMCVAYTDQNPANLTQNIYKYVVIDPVTGQNIVSPTVLPTGGSGTLIYSPRVFCLNQWFIILYTNNLGGGDYNLQFIAININTLEVTGPTNIAGSYQATQNLSFDAVVFDNALYVGYSTASGGQSIQFKYINTALQVSSTLTFVGYKATIMGMSVDSQYIYASFYDSGTQLGYVLAFNSALQIQMAPVNVITAQPVANITSIPQNGIVTVYYEVINFYTYDSTVLTDYIESVSVPVSTGVPTAPFIVVRSLGLASKAFIINNVQYFLGAFQSPYESTYFMVNGSISTQAMPIVVAKLAFENGAGYNNNGLPNALVNNATVSIPYEYKDLIQAVNKGTNLPVGSQVAGIYAQTGINLATFNLGSIPYDTVEIGSALHLSGGFLWMYDGYLPVEHNFLLYPDNVEGTGNNTGGALAPQQYFYQVCYEWSDNQGNIHRSAPSIPIEVDMSMENPAFVQPTPITFTAAGAAGQNFLDVSSEVGLLQGQYITDTTNPGYLLANTYIAEIPNGTTLQLSEPIVTTISGDTLQTIDTCSVTLNIPTLRLTYKIANPVKITIYRWSEGQQEYYQVTSILQPLLNNTTVDYITYTDTLADSTILGNNLIYTTGGVVEDIGAPGSNIMTLWQTRLMLVDAEDQNLIWYSKQVIENTPVEMSDLFTMYIAPTIGASGSTGPITALGAMDTNLIIFKKDAINVVQGTGPDNTGANNLFTDPIFVTSTVGCTNQQSIVNTPLGLMFQSDKGIWLLDRSLSTSYIGAPVETFALAASVESAILVPGTNQVRFTLSSGITLMYDYYYNQWSTFVGIPGISSCIYQSLHTYLDQYGRVFQETPNKYYDGDRPTLLSFTTGWLNLAGLQGYQRIYEFSFVGTYHSPHFIEVLVAYDFNAPSQRAMVSPQNFTGVWGSDSLWGQTSPWGGPFNLEQWRIHTDTQKCQVFQITMNEVFNPQYGDLAGPGFDISGINCQIGAKAAWRPYRGNQSAG